MVEMALSGEEGARIGAQLLPTYVCFKKTDFKTNAGVL